MNKDASNPEHLKRFVADVAVQKYVEEFLTDSLVSFALNPNWLLNRSLVAIPCRAGLTHEYVSIVADVVGEQDTRFAARFLHEFNEFPPFIEFRYSELSRVVDLSISFRHVIIEMLQGVAFICLPPDDLIIVCMPKEMLWPTTLDATKGYKILRN